ncbi:MAG TPA: hypothetical protein VHX66_10390 [Solirubrobacteraceae bacterium]|nr:hypothetical protein [Solirubrobacteraceae bacterium]
MLSTRGRVPWGVPGPWAPQHLDGHDPNDWRWAALSQRIVATAPALLAVLERHGMTEHDDQLYPGQAVPEVVDVSTALLAIGVDHARVWPVGSRVPRLYFIGHGAA